MKVRCIAALLFFSIVTAAAHAQLGIYGNFDATHDSLTSDQASFYGGTSASFWTYGPNVGIYYDFVHVGPIALGLDARANYLFGSQYKFRSALFGVRVAAKTPILPLRPYAQFSVGAGGPKSNHDNTGPFPTTNWSTKFEYMVFGGLDMTLVPHVDLRLAELGYGRMSGVNNTNTGSNPTDALFTVGTGIVVRF